LAAIHWEAYTRYWGRAIGVGNQLEPLGRAEQFLSLAMKNPTPLAYQVSSATLLRGQQYEEAAAEAMRGIASDPNDPDGYLAMAAVLSFTGKAGEALELVQRAMRLNPHYPPHSLYQLGLAQFGLGHLEEARSSLEKAIAGNAGDHWSERLLLATYGLLGQRAAGTKLLEAMTGKELRSDHGQGHSTSTGSASAAPANSDSAIASAAKPTRTTVLRAFRNRRRAADSIALSLCWNSPDLRTAQLSRGTMACHSFKPTRRSARR
jgi:tetratricopeptide (TPR) repeat protein